MLVNWQEILRYRMTYGYSEFVVPSRFEWLQEHGVLDESALNLTGERELVPNEVHSQQNEHQRVIKQLEDWGPELLRVQGERMSFPTSVLYRVVSQESRRRSQPM